MAENQPTVFLSYSHRDAAFASDLSERLRADGITPWLDTVEIKVGESIHEKVNEGLRRSDFFAIILSQPSVQSKWVQEELSSASSLEKYRKKGVFLLPILLEECDVPPLLLDRRYANFQRDPESAYQELVDAIRTHFFGPDGMPEPILGLQGIKHDFLKKASSNPKMFLELPPRQFEQLVAGLLRQFGYQVRLTPVSHDGGIDIIATRDALPSATPDQVIVVCKRYAHPVGAAQIREFAGAMIFAGAGSRPLRCVILFYQECCTGRTEATGAGAGR